MITLRDDVAKAEAVEVDEVTEEQAEHIEMSDRLKVGCGWECGLLGHEKTEVWVEQVRSPS